MPMRFVDEAAIARVLTWEALIPAVRAALVEFSSGSIEQPTRRIIPVASHGGWFAAMPATSPGTVGAKLVSFYPGNGALGLHTHHALIVLFQPETGVPLAVLDGRLITGMRTAAATAVFVDHAAAPDVSSLAILGAGVQARSHIAALGHVRKFTDIRIASRSTTSATVLAAEVGAHALPFEDAVRGADVVVCCTAAREPVLDGRWLKHGARVASVGWAGPDAGELDRATMANVIVVDSRDGARTESGNVRRFDATIHCELGELLAGTATVPQEATVVFDSLGMACEDLAAAALVARGLDL